MKYQLLLCELGTFQRESWVEKLEAQRFNYRQYKYMFLYHIFLYPDNVENGLLILLYYNIVLRRRLKNLALARLFTNF